ncbi:49k protein [Oxyplax ochracea nucleopolyhedrovirus]|uniref:49k protein n=1 Tax=Oxyplax ochracea nucleopolyhedrovirus TaxID=2083176 RepID=A0A2L0WTY7_9ABAC|nr:49k protein [Oxyplax ochracea nucleopolyhedrovirus]AVA31113.1 49k protein [Oxyplax ochracea nucleopolyhedrovirus]
MDNNNLLTLDRSDFKYLFLTSYFDFKELENIPSVPMAFIRKYLNCNFQNIDNATLQNYLGYLQNIQLKSCLATATESTDIFKFIKPQFQFICDRATFDILEFDSRMYIKPNTPVYATNFFTSNPKKLLTFLYAEFSKVFSDKNFVNIINNGNSYGCILTGNSGFLFDDSYVDWSGIKMCVSPRLQNNMHPFRLYLLGNDLAKHFAENKILPPQPSGVRNASSYKINNSMFMLKNFYKGLPLFKSNYTVINSTKIITRKPNEIFNEINKELNNSSFVKFIQRDYIFDAQFPTDLLDLLNEYMTVSSIMKLVTKFANEEPIPDVEYMREIIFDRYAVDNYRKLIIKMEVANRFPKMYDHESSYIFVTNDIVQIKNTLNAFYAPKQQLFSILSVNRLFGATEMIEFNLNLLIYRQSSPPILVNKLYVVNKNEKIYLVKHAFLNVVPAYLLVRGDYESKSELKSLRDLNPWVQNTLLKLLIPD